MASAKHAAGRPEVDDELAVKKVSPLVDHSLGIALLALIAIFVLKIRDDTDTMLLFASCLIAVIVGISAVRAGAEAIGRKLSQLRCGGNIPTDCRDPLKSNIAMKKWKDQAWQLAIHLSMSLFELKMIRQNPQWWQDPATCFINCPKEHYTPNDDPAALSNDMRLFYVLQLAIWMWTGFSCKWLEERRKDYVEMMLHHVVTVALILSSFINKQWAIGMIVLTCHDASDVVLDIMKMANYLKVEDAHGFFIVEAAFVTNTYISWPYFRLYCFPRYVIWGGSFLGYHHNCAKNGNAGFPHLNSSPLDEAGNPVPNWMVANVLLTILLCLHVFWFLLLHRIGMKIAFGAKPNQAGDAEYEITMKDGDKKKD